MNTSTENNGNNHKYRPTENRKIDFKALNDSLLRQSSSLVPDWLPGGKIIGNEYACGSLRGGDGQSCRVNLETGKWADFATTDKGGDLISLYAAINSKTQIEAARALAEDYHHLPSTRVFKPVTKSDIGVPPSDYDEPNFTCGFGNPSHVWEYKSEHGNTLFYIARYEPKSANDKKQFAPWSWSTSKHSWVMKGWANERPLYGLELLSSDANKPILIVEGEKAADAARSIAGHTYCVVTWSGGAQAWNKTDWRPIYGRTILIWPDADKPGVKAAHDIAADLYDHTKQIKIIDVSDKPDGWDAADAVKEGLNWSKMVEWAKPKANIFDVTKLKNASLASNHPAITQETLTNQVISIGHIQQEVPFKTQNGKPKSTYENLRVILDGLGVVVRYNVINKNEEIIIPGEKFSMDNYYNASLAWLSSWCNKLDMPTKNLGEMVTYLADKNPYNPVVAWINSKPWDGTSRLEDLYKTIKAENEETNETVLLLKKTFIRKWMISAIAGAYSPTGVVARGVLVLQGSQYLGKTRWFKNLVPADMGLAADGMILRPDDKDSVKQACSYWLVELGELDATFRKSDIAQLKAFISKDKDVIRTAYAKRESNFARRTVFFASVNPNYFLNDPSGNTRFWTIECEEINHSHGLDMQQIWAEVLQLYKQNESWFLDANENSLLNSHNEAFTSKSIIEEKIGTDLDWEAHTSKWSWQTSHQIMEMIGMLKTDHGDIIRCSNEIMKRNKKQKKKTMGLNKLFCPPVRFDKGDLRPPFLDRPDFNQ